MAKPRVLVVEDDAFMRKLLLFYLGKQFDVCGAGDGVEALVRVHEQAPDLILSDIMMPRMDGFALYIALQDNPATRTIPFIIVTAKVGEQDQQRARQLGIADFIIKPFDMHQLADRVAGLVGAAL